MIYKNRFEDFFFETTASTLDYMISTGGQVIFQGRAVKSPAKPVLRINVGQRVRDYLENKMPDFRDYDGVVVPHPDALLDFELQDVFGNPLETYRVLLDYTEDFTGTDMILSDPVNGHTDPRQKIFWASFNTTERDITIEIARNLELYFDVDMPYWIPNSGGTFNIHYTANTDFTFSYTGDWFTAVLSGDTIVITADENETEDERSGSICFTYFGTDFKERTKCYEIRQEEPFEVVFDVDVPIVVPYTADTYDIHYTANTPVEITVESDWFTASTDNGVIHIIVDKDADPSEAGTICFHYLGGVECYEIERAEEPPVDLVITFNPEPPFDFTYSGGTININYTANTAFTMSCESEGGWLSASLSGDVITLTATQNYDDDRYGRLCFTYRGSDYQQHTICYEVVQYALCASSAITDDITLTARTSQTCYKLGEYYGCERLKYVDMQQLVATTGSSFGECINLEEVHVPNLQYTKEEYRYPYTTGITCSSMVYSCGMFEHCTSLGEIELPSIKEISHGMFRNCSSLSAATIGDTLVSIGCYVFSGTPLTEITYLGTKEQLEGRVYAEEHYTSSQTSATLGWNYGSNIRRIICSDGVAVHTYKGDTIVPLEDFYSATADTFTRSTVKYNGALIPSGNTTLTELNFDCRNVEFNGYIVSATSLESINITGTTGVVLGAEGNNNNSFFITDCTNVENINIKGGNVWINAKTGSYHVGTNGANMVISSNGEIEIVSLFSLYLGSLTIIDRGVSGIIFRSECFRGNSGLTSINYSGTKSEWQSKKVYYSGWLTGSNVEVIHCSDGDITV